MKITFLSVMPSPYVQDLYASLALDGRVEIGVWYLEQEAPNTLWGEQVMPPFAEVLPGRWIGGGNTRIHYNPGIRGRLKQSDADLFVIVGYIGLTNQLAMRYLNRVGRPWIFWGEIPGLNKRTMLGNTIRKQLQAPLRTCSGIAAVGSHAVGAYQKIVARSDREFSSELGNAVDIGQSIEDDAGRVFANLPYVCDIASFEIAARNRKQENTVRFLYCGQLIHRKGVDLLCQAMTRLITSGLDARLTLVGEGPLRSTLMEGLPDAVAERIALHGFKQVNELPAIFADHDVFVLPSRHDGWGVVVNQAIGSGMPVIATEAVGAANDLVIPNVNGFRIQTDSLDALVHAMKYFVEHPSKIIEFSQRSLELAESVTLESAVDHWVAFFERCVLVEQPSPRRRKLLRDPPKGG